MFVLSPVHTSDKVEFNTVDFVDFQQSRTCGFGPVHSGNKVDRIGNKVERIGNKVDRDKLSNSRCCRFVVKTGKKVKRISNKVESIRQHRLCCRFVASFGNSRLSTKSTVLNSTLSPVSLRLSIYLSDVTRAENHYDNIV